MNDSPILVTPLQEQRLSPCRGSNRCRIIPFPPGTRLHQHISLSAWASPDFAILRTLSCRWYCFCQYTFVGHRLSSPTFAANNTMAANKIITSRSPTQSPTIRPATCMRIAACQYSLGLVHSNSLQADAGGQRCTAIWLSQQSSPRQCGSHAMSALYILRKGEEPAP